MSSQSKLQGSSRYVLAVNSFVKQMFDSKKTNRNNSSDNTKKKVVILNTQIQPSFLRKKLSLQDESKLTSSNNKQHSYQIQLNSLNIDEASEFIESGKTDTLFQHEGIQPQQNQDKFKKIVKRHLNEKVGLRDDSMSDLQVNQQKLSKVVIPKYDLNELFENPPLFDSTLLRYKDEIPEKLVPWKVMQRVISSPFNEDINKIKTLKTRVKFDITTVEDKSELIKKIDESAHKFPFYTLKLREDQIERLRSDVETKPNTSIKIKKIKHFKKIVSGNQSKPQHFGLNNIKTHFHDFYRQKMKLQPKQRESNKRVHFDQSESIGDTEDLKQQLKNQSQSVEPHKIQSQNYFKFAMGQSFKIPKESQQISIKIHTSENKNEDLDNQNSKVSSKIDEEKSENVKSDLSVSQCHSISAQEQENQKENKNYSRFLQGNSDTICESFQSLHKEKITKNNLKQYRTITLNNKIGSKAQSCIKQRPVWSRQISPLQAYQRRPHSNLRAVRNYILEYQNNTLASTIQETQERKHPRQDSQLSNLHNNQVQRFFTQSELKDYKHSSRSILNQNSRTPQNSDAPTIFRNFNEELPIFSRFRKPKMSVQPPTSESFSEQNGLYSTAFASRVGSPSQQMNRYSNIMSQINQSNTLAINSKMDKKIQIQPKQIEFRDIDLTNVVIEDAQRKVI
eukprot:403344244